MHKLACEYAQTLQMHSLDSLDKPVGHLSMNDRDRMGMWWLIHLDLFARLINDKPAVFSSQLSEWRVNMPRLAAEFSQERNKAVPTMAFLFRSRLTFILISYFQVSETLKYDSDRLAAITPLCEEVEALFEEWKIASSTHTFPCLSSWLTCIRKNGSKATKKGTSMAGSSATSHCRDILASFSCSEKHRTQTEASTNPCCQTTMT